MDAFMSKNFDLPENMFYFHNNDLHPLAFVLDWDTDDGFYKKLLNRYFADVLDEPNEHAIVLAKPDETRYVHNQIPAFDIKYIEDCFRLKDYPDPNKYLIQKSCPKVYKTTSIYDCWYHKKITWSELTGSKTVHSDDVARENEKWISCSKPDTDTTSSGDDLPKSQSVSCFRASSPTPSSDWPNKKTRLPYSVKEDVEIVKYIVRNNLAFDIAGQEMWKKMERAKVCKIRTWQSMKERYLKHIKYDVGSKSSKYNFLSPEDLKMLRQGLKIDVLKSKDRLKMKDQLLNKRIETVSSDGSY